MAKPKKTEYGVSSDKPGRATWPRPDEVREHVLGSIEGFQALENLSKQIEAVARINELIGIEPDRFQNNRWYAAARLRFNMTREEFDRLDDWDFLVLLEAHAGLVHSKAGPSSGAENLARETEDEKKSRRRAVIEPILTEKGLSVYRWEKNAKVTSKVGQRYLDGATDPRRDSSLKLAKELGLTELPL